MARIQILELPTIYREHGDDETPFVLVIDQCEPQRYVLADDQPPLSPWDGMAEKVGARAILVFPETVEIPANNVPVDPDGPLVRLQAEGYVEGIREKIKEQVLQGQEELARALRKP